MARFFIGSAVHKLDAKGRVSLPSDYREVLRAQGPDDAFVIVPAEPGTAHHIAFSRPGHERLIQRIGAMTHQSPAHKRAARRRFIAEARPVSVEEGGRFVLSRDLREGLGLEGAVRFVGDGETFQIWRPETWDAARAPEEALDAPLDLDLSGLVE